MLLAGFGESQALSERNEADLDDAYSPHGTSTWPHNPITLYTAGTSNGMLGGCYGPPWMRQCVPGGREALDESCKEAKPANLDTENVRAFITVSSLDSIENMPQAYGVPTDRPIVSPIGVRIAKSWADLMDGRIHKSLSQAGVIPPGTDSQWWVGNPEANCNGWSWTPLAGIFYGMIGSAESADAAWMYSGWDACGLLASHHHLCLSY